MSGLTVILLVACAYLACRGRKKESDTRENLEDRLLALRGRADYACDLRQYSCRKDFIDEQSDKNKSLIKVKYFRGPLAALENMKCLIKCSDGVTYVVDHPTHIFKTNLVLKRELILRFGIPILKEISILSIVICSPDNEFLGMDTDGGNCQIRSLKLYAGDRVNFAYTMNC